MPAVPGAAPGERLAQRHPHRLRCPPRRRTRSGAGRAARRRAPRPCTTAPAGGSRGRRPPAASGPRRRSRARSCPSLSSSAVERAGWPPAAAAPASSTAPSARASPGPRACRRSPRGRGWRRTRCRRPRLRHRAQGRAERRGHGPDAFVDVVVGVPRLVGLQPGGSASPEWRTARSGRRRAPSRRARSVPEKTRTMRHAADVRVDRGLDHLGDERAVRVAAQRARAARRPAPVTGGRLVLRRAAGSPRSSTSSSSATPSPVVGTTGSTRVEVAAGDRRLQVGDEGVVPDVLAGEVAVHQGLVLGLGDDPLDQRVPGLGDGVRCSGSASRGVGPGLVDGRARAGRAGRRPSRRRRASAGTAAARRPRTPAGRSATTASKSARGWSRWVTTTARGMPTAAHSSHSSRGRAVHPVDGGDHEQGGVGGPQPGPQLADEVGVTGGVEQVDVHPRVGARRRGQGRERPRRCSTSSWSETVVPSSTRPARGIVPVAASSASTRVVLPAPEWPTSTTLRTPSAPPGAC